MAHLVGATVAGAAAGGVLGALGAVALHPRGRPWVLWAVAAACLAGAVADVAAAGRLPSPHRQVNEDWLLAYRGWVYGSGYGIQLGVGVATIVTTSAVYVTLALAGVSGSGLAGASIGAIYGMVRGLPVLATARVHSAEQLRRLHRTMASSAPVVSRATAGVMAFVGASALVARLTVGR